MSNWRLKPLNNWLCAALVGIVALLLAGCSSLTDPLLETEQPVITAHAQLNQNSRVGQTFVTHYDGLAGIYFYLSPDQPGDGVVHLYLRADAQVNEDLAADDLAVSSSTLKVSDVGEPGWYGFFVPAENNPNAAYRYAFLKLEGGGQLLVGEGPGEAYLDGALYQNDAPQDAQAAFQLSYSRRAAALGIAGELAGWGGVLLVSAFLFLLPGWGLMGSIWPDWENLHWPEKLGISAGVSLAIYPLLLLWTDTIGLHLGALYAWLPPLAGAILVVWRLFRRWKSGAEPSCSGSAFSRQSIWINGTFAIIVLLVIFTRFWTIRRVEMPMWGDSVQHTVMTQLMLDQGGLFRSWEPYTPYQSLTVQFGFSAAAALFAWLTGSASPVAVLWIGQVMNILAILTLFPLASLLSRHCNGDAATPSANLWVGIGAVTLAGLISPMPAMYVNWGRYAQLTGQAILPIAVWMVWEILTQNPAQTTPKRQRIIQWGLAGLVVTGMVLSYYRTPHYFATLILALLAATLLTTPGISQWRLNIRRGLAQAGKMLLIAGVAIVLFLPWAARLAGGNLSNAVEAGVNKSSPLEVVLTDYQVWREVFSYVPGPLATLALAGLVIGILRKRWSVAALGLWAALLASWVALQLIRFPTANLIQNFAVVIMLYMPASLAGGWLAGAIVEQGMKWSFRPAQILSVLLVLGVAIWGAWKVKDIADPQNSAMIARPDLRAMQQLANFTSPQSLFFVEGFRVYNGSTAVGSDGGWWLPLIARRANTMPPQYALLNEAPITPEYTQKMVNLIAALEGHSPASTEGLAALCQASVTHVYIGQGQGNRSASRNTQLFAPAKLSDSPAFDLLYHQDRVYVFALTAEACR